VLGQNGESTLPVTDPFRGSIVVSIPACHAGDPGSIPGLGVSFLSRAGLLCFCVPASWLHYFVRGWPQCGWSQKQCIAIKAGHSKAIVPLANKIFPRRDLNPGLAGESRIS
jgi:hypothetical protein